MRCTPVIKPYNTSQITWSTPHHCRPQLHNRLPHLLGSHHNTLSQKNYIIFFNLGDSYTRSSWLLQGTSAFVFHKLLLTIPLKCNVAHTNCKCFKITNQRGVALVSLASIHPMRNEINTSKQNRCHAPLIIQALAIDLLTSVQHCIWAVLYVKCAVSLQITEYFKNEVGINKKYWNKK